MTEFLAALDHAKRTAKGPQLAAIIATLRATRDGKMASARAAELDRIKARQESKTILRTAPQAANHGPR